MTAVQVAIVCAALALSAPPNRRRRFGDRVARGRRRPRAPGEGVAGQIVLAELLAIAVAAGLPPASALARVAREVPASVAVEVEAALLEARRRGLEAALLSADGASAPVFHLLARSVHSGASVLDALDGHIAVLRGEERSRELVRLRRLPVMLLFPLALLILPGFVLLVLGPMLVEAYDRLSSTLPTVTGR